MAEFIRARIDQWEAAGDADRKRMRQEIQKALDELREIEGEEP